MDLAAATKTIGHVMRVWKQCAFFVLSVAVVALASANIHTAAAQADPQLAIDADANNGSGPCSPIDASANLAVGATGKVAVCLVNGDGTAVAAFNYRVTYNDTLIRAPEVADDGNALDDNPDANVGSTSFSSPNLGEGWDCTGSVGAFPLGDEDGIEGNGTGTAYSGGCGSAAGPNTLLSGPLQVISFVGVAPGSVTLSLTKAAVTDDDLNEVGSCRPAIDREVTCSDATIEVGGSGTPPTPATSATAGATPGTTSEAGVTPGASVAPGTVEAAGTPGVEGGAGTPAPGTTAASVSTAAAASSATSGTAAAKSTSTATAKKTASPTPAKTSASNDDGGGTNWVLIGVVAAVVIAAVGGGGGWYWFRMRPR